MKWIVKFAALAVIVAAIGCNSSVKVVAPVESGEAPSEQMMKDMQAESMKRMSPEMQKKMKDNAGKSGS